MRNSVEFIHCPLNNYVEMILTVDNQLVDPLIAAFSKTYDQASLMSVVQSSLDYTTIKAHLTEREAQEVKQLLVVVKHYYHHQLN